MSKKNKILVLSLAIALMLSIVVSISYAMYIFNISQGGSNIVRTDCFEITYSDMNPISLVNSIPMSDNEAKELTPYIFTISNVCNYAVDYNVNIETLNSSTMNLDGVKVRLGDFKPKVLGSIEDNDESVIINNNVLSSKTIKQGHLKAGASKTYNLRVYIDESSTYEQTGNKTFASKVVVSAKLNPNYTEAVLMRGDLFNKKIKTLSGIENPNPTTSNTSILAIQRSDSLPSESDNYVDVADNSSDKPIYVWFKDGVIYIYCENDKIYLNEDSSYLFASLDSISQLDISYFDTSNVTNMLGMFSHMISLTSLDISNLDTSNATNMDSMFSYLTSLLSLDISNLDTSNANSIRNLFYGDSKITSIDVSNLDTSNVTSMSGMFWNMDGLTQLDISNLDTSNVTDMSYLFGQLDNVMSINVGSFFDTRKVTNMHYMFYGSSKLEDIDLSTFDTSNVTDMSGMFYNMTLTSLDLSGFDTSKVTNMSYMFFGMNQLTSLDVSSFEASGVVDMSGMFAYMTKLETINLTNFNTSNVKKMGDMFRSNYSLQVLDLSSFDTSNVTNMGGMFYYANSLTTILVGNKWNTSNLVGNDAISPVDCGSKDMFYLTSNIVGGAGTRYSINNINGEYARVDDPDNGKPGYLTLKTS